MPGHHIQVDVKFLTFKGKRGEKVRRFQYTAIDDATRVRALKVYEKHTQANAIDFIGAFLTAVGVMRSSLWTLNSAVNAGVLCFGPECPKLSSPA